jgi:DnaA-homolog protein
VTQLLLDLKPEQIPTLDNFVAGDNAELVSRLDALADGRSFDAIYLWGPDGCGKSHLLAATVARSTGKRPVCAMKGAEAGAEITAPTGALIAIDDVDALGEPAQIALFKVFNAARLAGFALLLAGPEPPLRLAVREDLRTRIGQMLVFEVKALTDEEKSAALHRHALMRGMRVDAGLVRYLLNHGRRDLPSLMAVLDGLDRISLEQQRPATLPLLKEVMQLQFDNDKNEDNEPDSL